MSNKTAIVVFGLNYIMELDAKPGVLFWSSRLHVDADGHPEAYHPSGSPPGLDYLANAGHPGNWWGIATNSHGAPYRQTAGHPAPGFYISTTALEDRAISGDNPARYVHSGEVPFIVLPSKPHFSPHQQLGDLAIVFNTDNGRFSWAIYADIGPSNEIGEGSMALSNALGLSASPKTGGTEKEIIATVFFPGSKVGWPRSSDELSRAALKLFEAWGGLKSCELAMPQFAWSKFKL